MCSIYGSSSLNMFEILHDATIDRGHYACSFLSILGKTTYLQQFEGHPTPIDKVNFNKTTKFYLGHNQAPTSSQRKYNKNTSHPFTCGDWMVAHNGVLTNFKQLNDKYTKKNKNPVDSSVIPALLQHFTEEYEGCKELEIIQTVLNLLEGTFAVWIYNTTSNKIYLARQGSTLFANLKTRDFCSIKSKDWVELKEGMVYEITKTKIINRVEFKNTTPFFTI